MRGFVGCLWLALLLTPLVVTAQEENGKEMPSGTARDGGGSSSAPGWGIGGGIISKREAYRGFDDRVIPIPLFNYRGEKLEVNGLFVNYKFWSSESSTFGLRARPRFDGYDEDDSDFLEGMDEREFSIDAGAYYKYKFGKNFELELNAAGDLLDRHGGQEVSIGLSKRFFVADFKGIFTPSISYIYQSKQLADFYYGVRPDEALPGRPAYEAGPADNYEVGISFFYRLNRRGSLFTLFKYQILDSTITSSPIVERDNDSSLIIGYTHRLGGGKN
ncbi:MAG: MipA/OmpV family protein [Gammaproteobacteria bacterium]|nr:MipA/OmpV family protein [Gammaproteobacteria bacterium]